MITTIESRNELLDTLGQIRLKDSYMRPEETSPQERFAFVASSFCGGDDELAQRLYDYISKHWLSPSSPQLSFGRTKQGLPIACFLPYLPDTTRGLIDTWAEVSELSVIGGGIGLGVGIRQPDEKSVGIIPHLRTYDAGCTAYKQGQTRRGSYAAYLDISHPEIISFLNTRRVSGVGGDYNYKLMNIHNGVNIPDSFMRKIWFISTIAPILKEKSVVKYKNLVKAIETIKSVESDKKWIEGHIDVNNLTIENIPDIIKKMDEWDLIDPHTKHVKETISATELWERILVTRAETGEPLIHFIDTSNSKLPAFQKKLGLSVKQSNLCVVGETLILTKKGQFPIKDLVDQEISVWNGEEWSNVTVAKTGTEQQLVQVDLSNGTSIICTPYHKFILRCDRALPIKEMARTEAQNLKIGDTLVKTPLPIIKGDKKYDINQPYAHGFFCGDCETEKGVLNLHVEEKFKVPINATLECRLKWLAGYLDADGCIVTSGNVQSIQASCIYKKFLIDIQTMLVGMGITSKISNVLETKKTMLPDGKGEKEGERKEDCKELWKILISSCGLNQLVELGFETKRLKWTNLAEKNNNKFVSVTRVTKLDRLDDTYCFTEPLNNAAIFNGNLISQCSEITLPTDENRTAVCCLASLNLDYYDEWWENQQFYLDVATYLDNVLQYFIDNAPRTLKRAIFSATSERAIGIGALGFHSYLQSKNIAIESMEAYNLNNHIFRTISSNLNKVNLILGNLRGEAPDCIGTGRRFSHMMAIAPNATSSIIMGNTSPSCEPFRANVYKQDTLSGSHITYNKHLKKLLEGRIKDPLTLKNIFASIKMYDGSVQHLDCLSEHEKKVFKTWPEINQMTLIRLAAARQRFIDQAQSLSLFFNPNERKDYVHAVHLEAWRAGLKTLYYFRSKKILGVDKVNHNSKIENTESTESFVEPETCTFCEG
jgi:ribonucleotide reductase alpha subunit